MQTAGTAQDKVIEQLTLRVAQLTEDIENVHAHYQKIIEGIAGSDNTIDMGPLERGVHSLPWVKIASVRKKTQFFIAAMHLSHQGSQVKKLHYLGRLTRMK